MSDIQTLSRNDALSKSKRFRGDLLGDPTRLIGIDSGAVKRWYNGNLAAGATTLYSCPNWKRARANGGLFTVHNPTGGAIAIDVHHVPSGGAVNANNKLATLSIAANETRTILNWYIWHCIMKGEAIVINPGGAGLNAWGVMQEIKEEAASFIGGAVNNIAAATDTTIVTCPALRTLLPVSVVGHNYNAGVAAVQINARESGVAAGTTNQFSKQTGIASSGEFEHPASPYSILPHVQIGQGGVISGRSDVTNVNLWCNALLL